MVSRISHRTPSLLAIAVTGLLAWAGKSPALATCAPGAGDKPDLGFIDSNCDGIDGDKAGAIFVATGGDDNNDGSFGSPKKSVLAAVTAAVGTGKDVYVAGGTYTGKVPFPGSADNIGVYGGYDAQTWQRSAANVTTLEAPGQVVGVARPGIVLQLLTIHSLDASSASSSYGVRAFGAATAALSRVTIQTVKGADGPDGAPSPPAKAKLVEMDGASPDSNACDQSRGAGGVGTGHLAGGLGGTWNDPQFTMKGYDGKSEPTDPSVSGGIGGTIAGQKGGAGTNGHSGSPAAGGSATLARVALFYQAEPGGTGTDGTRGAGGGGGAAGNYICVSGSGGGAGGLGGVGGQGGQGGGGSIGVFAGTGARILVLDASVIHTNNGGHGGFGQPGQPSGPGGLGGASASAFDGQTTWFGGAGGNGGWGGEGGRGGGGAGGASIGVLAVDARAVVADDSQITIGSGGLGGNGGNDGKPGVALKTAEVATAGGSVPATGDFDGDGIDDATDVCPLAAGPGDGCPLPQDVPTGPVAGDPAATAPADSLSGSGTTATSTVAVSVLPTSPCVYRSVFRIRINARTAHIKTARLTLDGHRLKLVKRSPRRWIAKADLRHSTRTRHTLVIRGRLRDGRRFKQTRRYRTCGA
jgi:hypothetical protein